MTTDTNREVSTTEALGNFDASLAEAFRRRDPGNQDSGDSKQDTGDSATTPATSRPESTTTTTSRPRELTTREAILGEVTLDELRAHPTLGPALKSFADKEAAAQIRGTRVQVERELTPRLREQLRLELAAKEFASMSKEDLAEALIDPETVALYSKVQTLPPPPPPPTEQDVELATLRTVIAHTDSRLQGLELPEDVKAKLNPQQYYNDHPNVEAMELLRQWQSDISDAEVTAKVAKTTKPVSEAELKAAEIERGADSLRTSQRTITNTPGFTGAPSMDLMTTPSDILLANAFSRRAAAAR